MDRLGALRGRPEVLPGLFAVASFVALAAAEGGFEPTSWYPAALFLLGLLAVTVVVLGRRGELRSRPSLSVAIALLAAFVAWTFLSIAWSQVQGDAWDGANRNLMYLTAFALFALLPWRDSTAALVLGAHCVGLAAVALVTVVDVATAADPTLSLLGGRLADPTGYHNATAALLLAAFFPALLLASRGEVPWPARGLLLASAGTLLEVAIMPQSRGSVIAFPIVAVAFLALAPGRVRLLIWALPVAVAAALASGPLLDVYTAATEEGGDAPAAFDSALTAIALSAAALLAIGCALGLAERRVPLSEPVRRNGSRAVGAVAAAGAVVGIVVGLSATGNPVTWVGDRWDDFKAGQEVEFGESRFASGLGSNRYDFWRVAMDDFAEDPMIGLGVEQFAVEYLTGRESDEEPLHPHSVEVRIVSQTGLMGTLLFAGFLVVATIAALRTRLRAGNTLGGAVAVGALAAFAYWFAHGSGDWFWPFAGLSAPAFAFLALAGSELDGGDGGVAEAGPGRRTPWPLLAAGGAVALLAAASYVLPWAAARDAKIAAENWPANLQGAYDRLERARDLNFLSDRPDLIAGTIAARAGDRARARAAFEAALERNSASWYAQLELGVLDALADERAPALGHLRAARRISPTDPLVRSTLRKVAQGSSVTLAQVDEELQSRICGRIGRTEATPDCE
jgi:O-antigen ligase